jgi:hypothetical protein
VENTQQICILQHPKRKLAYSYAVRAFFLASFSWVMPCDAIPYFVAAQSVLSPCHHAVKTVIASDSIPLHQLWGNILGLNFVLLCQRVGTQDAKTLWYPKLSTIWTTWCPIPFSAAIALTVVCQLPLVSPPIFPSFSQQGKLSQATNTELVGNVCVPIFKMFLPMVWHR